MRAIYRKIADAAGNKHQRQQNFRLRRLHRHQCPVLVRSQWVIRFNINHMSPKSVQFRVTMVAYSAGKGKIGIVPP